MKQYGIIKKELSNKIPIYAGKQYERIKKIGYKIIEFTYDVNPDYPDDKMLIGQKEIKRIFYK